MNREVGSTYTTNFIIVKWHGGCPMEKRLCKLRRFRERDFQKFLRKCCSSTLSTYFIPRFQWFLFRRESKMSSLHEAAGRETVLWLKGNGVWGGHWIPATRCLSYFWPLTSLCKQKEKFLTGINCVPPFLWTSHKLPLRNVFMWAAAVKSTSHPSYVRSCTFDSMCPNEILSPGTYISPQEVMDQN